MHTEPTRTCGAGEHTWIITTAISIPISAITIITIVTIAIAIASHTRTPEVPASIHGPFLALGVAEKGRELLPFASVLPSHESKV